MPGVHLCRTVPGQVATLLVMGGGAQSAPLQQTLGDWVVSQVSPGAQCPVVSQKHPFEPAMQMGGTAPDGAILAHTLPTPGLPQPQHWVLGQVPQSIKPPQQSEITPQFLPRSAQVALVQTIVEPPVAAIAPPSTPRKPPEPFPPIVPSLPAVLLVPTAELPVPATDDPLDPLPPTIPLLAPPAPEPLAASLVLPPQPVAILIALRVTNRYWGFTEVSPFPTVRRDF